MHSRRSFATIVDALPTPAPYLPFVPCRPALHASSSLPTPIATSSKVTLSDPLWGTPGPFPRDPISAALQFATDDDLVAALVLSREDTTSWMASIDPSVAFVALRERPTYPVFLQEIGLCLDRVYTRLQRKGTHELLVTDLLLKQSDPRLLRQVIELDSRASDAHRLRSSLIVSLFAHIARHIESRAISPLSRTTNLHMARLLMADNQSRHLQTVFNDLYRVAENDAKSIWPLFQIIAHVLRSDVHTASSMFMALVQDDREIVPRKFLGKSNPAHPAWREIMMLAAITRCTLRWNMVDDSHDLADRLLAHMLQHGPTGADMDAVLETARVATSIGADSMVDWVQDTFRRMATTGKVSPIPSVAMDDVLDARPNPAWYLSLPPEAYEPPSPRALITLANQRDASPELLARVSSDVARSDPATAVQLIADPLLRSLSRHTMIDELRQLSAERPPVLSAAALLNVVQAAMRRGDRQLARDFLHDYERQMERGASGFKTQDRLVLAEGFIIAKSPRHASAQLEALRQSNEPGTRDAVLRVIHRLGRASAFARLARPLWRIKARDI